ncbi:Putative binding protein precursor [Planctomycetes bacterium MalM25]|nr:Putative binding protein precursor [Planctomycetes bacterium MalM25]
MAVSLLALALAGAGLWWLTRTRAKTADAGAELVVYCAAGVSPAVAPILKQFRAERRGKARLQVGPSGVLETQLRLANEGDLFIPAAADPYLLRLRESGKVSEIVPVARMRLVLACSPYGSLGVGSLPELIESGVSYGLCNVQAAAGQRTRESLEAHGLWDTASRAATASFSTVTELAEAVRNGGRLRAGIVWSTTARQFGLRAIDLPELEGSEAVIGAGVLASSGHAAAARRLARYLVAPDGGRTILLRQGYLVDGSGLASPPGAVRSPLQAAEAEGTIDE